MYRVLGEKTSFLGALLYIFLYGVSLFIPFIWFCVVCFGKAKSHLYFLLSFYNTVLVMDADAFI